MGKRAGLSGQKAACPVAFPQGSAWVPGSPETCAAEDLAWVSVFLGVQAGAR